VVALLIGISKYENLSSQSRGGIEADDVETGNLGYPHIDAHQTHDVLANLGLFKDDCALSAGLSAAAACPFPRNIKILTESQARVADIQAAFTWLDAQEDQNTRVIIAYSGHGGRIPDDNGDESDGLDEFIAGYDVKADITYQNIITDDQLASWLDQLESKQIVVLVDACYSGGVGDVSALAAADARSKSLPLLASGLAAQAPGLEVGEGLARDLGQSGRVVLAASTAQQLSWEFSALSHGVFTYYLLMALMDRAADTNHNGWVSAEEAYTYLVARVDKYVFPRTGKHQNPQIYDGVAGQVDLTRP
jgi:hypothetical protein